jgi:hypothetical protein
VLEMAFGGSEAVVTTLGRVSVPAAALGVAVTRHGYAVAAKSLSSLTSRSYSATNETGGNTGSSGSNNPYGAKGKPDHQQKVKELTEKAKSENPNKNIVTEKKIQVEGSNRRPDVQAVDPKTNKTTKIYEAERHPNSKRNVAREAEYKRLEIPNETHKVGGN